MPSPLRRHPAEEDSPVGASYAELFFDLVFVLAVTQLSSALVDDLTVAGATQTLVLLLAAWWAWIYTTWMTNWFDPETRAVRAILLVGMLASLCGAIAIPDAFDDRAGLFVAGYVGLQLIRNGFMVLATQRSDPLHAPLVRIFVWSAWVSMIWLAGALVEGEARIAVWIVALVLDYAGPLAGHWAPRLGRSVPADWDLVPSHFSERLQLFVILALGETIVAAGVSASELEMDAMRIAAVVVSFGVSVAFWWLYFDYHAEGVARELQARDAERGRLGELLSYLHVPIVAGIIVSAVAAELVIAHPGERLHIDEMLPLAAGPALFLVGSVFFKASVLHAQWRQRLVAAVVILVITLSGVFATALAAWSLVLIVLVGVALYETVKLKDTASTDV
ncbi:low temperature requirement protein A [Nocardioides panacis]|uniref:Low temperature requirement protein A n=1 Tax=Nocardioides panacis TaxID=2849501 RepID=A0A975Y0N3_9ACTN|nr:low temperature requirement protein A [Nocardioides panacis]QWZ08647.1 low temperature requirement protein A [Nocardioides panacis]